MQLQRTSYMNIGYIRNKIYCVHINVCTCILEINESSKISLLSVLSNKTDSRALSQPIFVLLNSTLPGSLEPNPFIVYWTQPCQVLLNQPFQVLLNPTLSGSLEPYPVRFSWTHPCHVVFNPTLSGSLEPNPSRFSWTQPCQGFFNLTLPGTLEPNPARFSWT